MKHRAISWIVVVALLAPITAKAYEPAIVAPDGFSQASELLAPGSKKVANTREHAAASGGSAFDGILGLIDEMGKNARLRRASRSKAANGIILAHDYTVCNGPQCFSCTHTKVEKCDQKDVKVCIGIENGLPVCRWETTFTNCRMVDGGHTCN